MNVFLSYSRKDEEVALQLGRAFASRGVSLWIDQLEIGSGDRWDSEVAGALKRCEVLLVLLSKESVASDNVLDEISYALDARKQVVPVLLEPCDKPLRLTRHQHIDFTNRSSDSVNKVVDAVKRRMHVPGATPPAVANAKEPRKSSAEAKAGLSPQAPWPFEQSHRDSRSEPAKTSLSPSAAWPFPSSPKK